MTTTGGVGTHKIRIGIDMSGFTPFVAAGYVKESYRNIVIQNNIFIYNGQVNGGDPQAIYLTDVNEGEVVGNSCYYDDALSNNKFFAVGYTSIYASKTGAATTSGYFVGDNRRLAFKASN